MSEQTARPPETRRRSGGRAARVASRQRPLEENDRPVRPGLPGGLFKPLSDAQLRLVYETALELLEDVGMGTPVPEFVQVVTEAGGHVDEHGRLRYPPGLV